MSKTIKVTHEKEMVKKTKKYLLLELVVDRSTNFIFLRGIGLEAHGLLGGLGGHELDGLQSLVGLAHAPIAPRNLVGAAIVVGHNAIVPAGGEVVVNARSDGVWVGVVALGLVSAREDEVSGGIDHLHDVLQVGISLDIAVRVRDLVGAVLLEVGNLALV